MTGKGGGEPRRRWGLPSDDGSNVWWRHGVDTGETQQQHQSNCSRGRAGGAEQGGGGGSRRGARAR